MLSDAAFDAGCTRCGRHMSDAQVGVAAAAIFHWFPLDCKVADQIAVSFSQECGGPQASKKSSCSRLFDVC